MIMESSFKMAISLLATISISTTLAVAMIPKQEKIIPTIIDSTINLPCSIPQTTKLMWDHVVNYNQTVIALNGIIVVPQSANHSKFEVYTSGNMQSLQIKSLTLRDDGTYRCADIQNVNYKESFKVNILVRPTRVELLPIPSTGIDEGSVFILECEADGGKPPPIFEWYIEGPYKNRTKLPSAESDIMYQNGTGLRTSQVPISIDRTFYQSRVSCLTEISYFFKVQNNASLDVNLFPGVPTLRNFDGIFNNGERKTVICESRGSRPAANITWYINNVPQPSVNTQVYRDPDDTFFVSSSLTRTFDRSLDGKNLTCRAMNVVLQRQNREPVETTVVLRMAYLPIINAVNGSLDVYEHRQVILQCHISALPRPTKNEVFWLKNGVIIRESPRIQYNSSNTTGEFDLIVRDVNRFDIGQYLCQASNSLGLARSTPPLALNVLYRPVCLSSSIEKVAASVGQTVTLTCRVTANPTNVTVTWRYKTRQSIIQENQPSFTDPGVDKTATSSIQIPINIGIDYTDVECIATNSMGTMIQPCLYMIVKPGPPEIPTGCNITLGKPDELDIRCIPGFSGGGQQYFILQRVDGKSFVTINTNDVEPMFNVSNLERGQNYTYRVCSASDTYMGTVSCGMAMFFKTPGDSGATNQEPVAAASPQDTTLYIVGGSLGFVFLVLLAVVVVVCIVKRRQQSEEHIENVYVDVTDSHGDHHRYHLNPEGESKQDHNILPSKLEEEDHHHHHHHHHHSSTPPKTSHYFDISSTEETGPATHLKLKAIANTSKNTFVRKSEPSYELGNRIINPAVEDIYAVSTKHRNYKPENVNTSESKHLTASRLTLSSASSKEGLCYSESDIQKALDMSGDAKILSDFTKSLRRSTSLRMLDMDGVDLDLNHHLPDDSKLKMCNSKAENHNEHVTVEQEFTKEINGKHISDDTQTNKKSVVIEGENNDVSNGNNDSDDDDAFVVISDSLEDSQHSKGLNDNIFVDTQAAKYNIDKNEDDEAKLRRRRSYHRAVRTNSLSSNTINNKIKNGDKELDGIDTSVGTGNHIYDKYSNYDRPKSLMSRESDGTGNGSVPTPDKTNTGLLNNNLNSSHDNKTFKSKLDGEHDASLSQNVEAYF